MILEKEWNYLSQLERFFGPKEAIAFFLSINFRGTYRSLFNDDHQTRTFFGRHLSWREGGGSSSSSSSSISISQLMNEAGGRGEEIAF